MTFDKLRSAIPVTMKIGPSDARIYFSHETLIIMLATYRLAPPFALPLSRDFYYSREYLGKHLAVF
jgi:hypothetical protein